MATRGVASARLQGRAAGASPPRYVGAGRVGARAGGSGVLLVALAFATLFAALSAVVWRQSRALEALRGVEQLRSEASLLEARRAQLSRRVQQLERRSRVLSVARERLDMRLPRAEEIVILPVPSVGQRGGER